MLQLNIFSSYITADIMYHIITHLILMDIRKYSFSSFGNAFKEFIFIEDHKLI